PRSPRVRCSAASSRASTTRRPRPFRGCARSCAWRTRWRWSPITCGPPSRASLPSTSAGMKGRTPASAPRTSYGRWPKRRRGQARVHNHLLGGGFGRRLEVDFVVRAVQIAKQVSGPVKVVWTREEDIQHDMYRPYYYDRIAAGLDAGGKPVAWTHRVAGSSI